MTWVLKDRGVTSHWLSSFTCDQVYPALSKVNQEQILGVPWVTLALLVPGLHLCSCCCMCLRCFPEHSHLPTYPSVPSPVSAPEPCWPSVSCRHMLMHIFPTPHSESLGARVALLFSFLFHILSRIQCACPDVNEIIHQGEQHLQKQGTQFIAVVIMTVLLFLKTSPLCPALDSTMLLSLITTSPMMGIKGH